MQGITEEKARNGNKFTIKQLEKTKKSLLVRLEKLNDQSKKDQVINFEELGIDRLFVDEADGYKNLYLYTKMRNVAGIAQTEALKSSDMFMKEKVWYSLQEHQSATVWWNYIPCRDTCSIIHWWSITYSILTHGHQLSEKQ